MFTIRRRANRPVMVKSEPTPEFLALLCRLRALSAEDEKLASLIEGLEPYLPTEPATATVAASE